VAANDQTLHEHYRRGVARRAHRDFALVDAHLGPAFGPRPPRARARLAAPLLRASRTALVAEAVRRTGIDPYAARQLLEVAIERSHDRRLWVRGGAREARAAAQRLLLRMSRAALAGATLGFTL
jgi:hypothetical protein